MEEIARPALRLRTQAASERPTAPALMLRPIPTSTTARAPTSRRRSRATMQEAQALSHSRALWITVFSPRLSLATSTLSVRSPKR